jgi:hypothetical protein
VVIEEFLVANATMTNFFFLMPFLVMTDTFSCQRRGMCDSFCKAFVEGFPKTYHMTHLGDQKYLVAI